MKFLSILSLFLWLSFTTTTSTAFVLLPASLSVPRSSTLLSEKREALSDIDIMCIMNSADLCSYYDECNIEEREALLNRLEEQTDILSERVAMMTCLTKHLKTGDHKHLEDQETQNVKTAILNAVQEQESSSVVLP